MIRVTIATHIPPFTLIRIVAGVVVLIHAHVAPAVLNSPGGAWGELARLTKAALQEVSNAR